MNAEQIRLEEDRTQKLPWKWGPYLSERQWGTVQGLQRRWQCLGLNEEAVEVILEAITQAGYRPGDDIALCLDPATSEMWQDGQWSSVLDVQDEYEDDNGDEE